MDFKEAQKESWQQRKPFQFIQYGFLGKWYADLFFQRIPSIEERFAVLLRKSKWKEYMTAVQTPEEMGAASVFRPTAGDAIKVLEYMYPELIAEQDVV